MNQRACFGRSYKENDDECKLLCNDAVECRAVYQENLRKSATYIPYSSYQQQPSYLNRYGNYQSPYTQPAPILRTETPVVHYPQNLPTKFSEEECEKTPLIQKVGHNAAIGAAEAILRETYLVFKDALSRIKRY